MSSHSTAGARSKRGRKRSGTSSHWSLPHFTEEEDGFRCKYCSTLLTRGENGHSNLFNHLKGLHIEIFMKNCPAELNKKCKEEEKKKDDAVKDEPPFDREIYLQKLTRFMVTSDQPYSLVDNPDFCDLIDYISKDKSVTEVPGRTFMTERISKEYDEKKYSIAKLIQDSASDVSLVIDGWQSSNQISFQGVMCRVVDKNWKLLTFPIDLTELYGPHSGENLAESLLQILNEMDLIDKIVSITTDNAANMGTFFHHFKTKLNELGVDFTIDDQRVKCLAHVLNLACKALIAVAEGSVPVERLKEGIVKLRNGSTRRRFYFQQCEVFKTDKLIPRLDCSTRWNSTHDAIKRALEMQKPLQASFAGIEDLQEFSMSPLEWESLKKLKEILDPFKQATMMISTEKHPNIASSTMIFQYIFQHCNSMIENYRRNSKGKKKSSEDSWVLTGLTKAKEKLEEYYGHSDGKAYVIGTVLHPSFKLEWYKTADGWTQEWIDGCKQKVQNEWERKYKPPPVASQETPSDSNDVLGRMYQTQMKHIIKADELQTYLSTPIIPKKQLEKVGILEWWKSRETEFPNLARMARDFLSVGGSGVPAERFFSSGTDILTDNRQRLTAQHIKELMCLKYWYKTFSNEAEGKENVRDN